MKLIRRLCVLVIIGLCFTSIIGQEKITLLSLLDEMIDMDRLTRVSGIQYRSVQFSSYDRRSISAYEEGWFANDDGFGRDPVIPGFEVVIKEPGENGIGEYLICDVQKPGVILRLWSARIRGNIRMFIDDMSSPFYEGNAQDFFWKLPEILMGDDIPQGLFRQFDAVYFPIPFSERLRIEWIGNLNETHFYHVGIRIYDRGVEVEPFSQEALAKCATKVEEVVRVLAGKELVPIKDFQSREIEIAPSGTEIIWEKIGTGAIKEFLIRTQAFDPEAVLRKCILNIYFDNSPTPHVHAPLGDFFGAAPGINPYNSVAFSVGEDGTMISRFVMPFKQNARIEVVNNSQETVRLFAGITDQDYRWEDGKSMHFRARWRIRHEVTASNINIVDYPYLMAIGQGRVVGAATYVYNPSNIPTSGGNWWGEGDEKIFVDDDEFPSFFGTGSEDYYNYSWSSPRIFSYPYCGQPRNDGPGNRGYVANFRWHILDDIPFNRNLAFYMELFHHSVVPRFAYGSIVYFYGMHGTIDDYIEISSDDIRDLPYYIWSPEAQRGARGHRFVMAEDVVIRNRSARVEEGKYWAEGKILMWKPTRKGDKLRFRINCEEEMEDTRIGFTMAKMPDGGQISVFVNGERTNIGGREVISLYEVHQTVLDNFFTDPVRLNRGRNEIIFESIDETTGKKIGIDFIWIREPGKETRWGI